MKPETQQRIGANRGAQGVLAPPILKLAPSNNIHAYMYQKYLLTKKKKN